jgi:hypothetical protein
MQECYVRHLWPPPRVHDLAQTRAVSCLKSYTMKDIKISCIQMILPLLTPPKHRNRTQPSRPTSPFQTHELKAITIYVLQSLLQAEAYTKNQFKLWRNVQPAQSLPRETHSILKRCRKKRQYLLMIIGRFSSAISFERQDLACLPYFIPECSNF